MQHHPTRNHRLIALACCILGLGACDGVTASQMPDPSSGNLGAGYQQAAWGDNVTITYENGSLRYVSNGLPNHARDAEYAVGGGAGGGPIPNPGTAVAIADPTRAQDYNFLIPLTPTRATIPTATNLGTIGVMISGAALFNPYEGDGVTVATASNFSVKGTGGKDVWFLDSCSGHPVPTMGMYHYHALPKCVTATVDQASGPSHLIGIAFDGYPIYGDRDMSGNPVPMNALDACNGITSPTPEFPDGVYHYVLLDVTGPASSIRCFSGVVDPSLLQHGGGMVPPPR